jgi:hypothetical protein
MACFIVVGIVALLTCCYLDDAQLTIEQNSNITVGHNGTVTSTMNNRGYPLTCIAIRNEMPRWNITCVDKTKMFFPSYAPEYYYSTPMEVFEQSETRISMLCKSTKTIVKSRRIPYYKVKPILNCIPEDDEKKDQNEAGICNWHLIKTSGDVAFESSEVDVHVSKTD